MAHDLLGGTTETNWARGVSNKTSASPLPHTPTSTSIGWDKRTRVRRLKHIVKKAAQGDQSAIIRLQQIQQTLSQRAAAGDTRATVILQQIQSWYAQYLDTTTATLPYQYQALYQAPYQIPYNSLSGDSLNDDEGAIAREEGACERQAVARMRGIGSKPTDQPIDVFGRSRQRSWQRSGSRKRRLRQLVQKAAQGDTQASARLQLIQQRLSQRAASGDTRATSLLQKIQQWYASYQTQYQNIAPSYQTQYQTPYQTPYPTPYQALYQAPYQQPYTPSAPADEEAELATTNPDL